MTDDPLYKPLSLPPNGPADPRPRRALRLGLLALAVALGAGAVVVGARRDRPAADVAVAPIEAAPKPVPAAPVAAAPSPPAAPVATAGGDTVEIQHGVKIIRLGAASSSASVAIPVPGQPAAVAGAIALRPAPDPRLVESSPFGALPRIGSDGSRAAVVYARPIDPAAAALAGAPRIALVAAGMGLGQTATAALSRRLPPAVTFAFPPDGPDLATQVAETRAAGHEAVLQLPDVLAPPAADVPSSPSDPLSALHRLMTRFTGYAGAARPASGAADDPAVRRDIEARGLYFLDSTPPVDPPAHEPGSPGVDVLVPPGAEAASLDRLVERARAKGTAIGWVADPQASAEAVAAFTGGLAARSVVLVPLSALADTAAGPMARGK